MGKVTKSTTYTCDAGCGATGEARVVDGRQIGTRPGSQWDEPVFAEVEAPPFYWGEHNGVFVCGARACQDRLCAYVEAQSNWEATLNAVDLTEKKKMEQAIQAWVTDNPRPKWKTS